MLPPPRRSETPQELCARAERATAEAKQLILATRHIVDAACESAAEWQFKLTADRQRPIKAAHSRASG